MSSVGQATPRKLHFSPVFPSQSVSSYSALGRSPSERLPPVHLSTIGRSELVKWLNQELDMNLKDISQCNNGAAACQMCERLNLQTNPINMKRVDFNANSSYYKEKNWRLLQHAFNVLEIDYNIDVDKCQSGNQLPLLMVFRFFKQRFDQWTVELAAAGQPIPPYDAAARRALSKTGDIKDPLAPPTPTLRSISSARLSRGSERAVKDGSSATDSASIGKAAGTHTSDTRSSDASSDTLQQIQRKKPSVWRKLKRALSKRSGSE